MRTLHIMCGSEPNMGIDYQGNIATCSDVNEHAVAAILATHSDGTEHTAATTSNSTYYAMHLSHECVFYAYIWCDVAVQLCHLYIELCKYAYFLIFFMIL